MSKFREDDQAGNDVMQAFWESPVGKLWKEMDKEAIRKLQEEETPKAMAYLLPVSEMKIARFKSTKLEVTKIMDEATTEEIQASKSLGVARHDLEKVGGIHFTAEELAEINEINNELKELEDRFDTLLINKYDE